MSTRLPESVGQVPIRLDMPELGLFFVLRLAARQFSIGPLSSGEQPEIALECLPFPESGNVVQGGLGKNLLWAFGVDRVSEAELRELTAPQDGEGLTTEEKTIVDIKLIETVHGSVVQAIFFNFDLVGTRVTFDSHVLTAGLVANNEGEWKIYLGRILDNGDIVNSG